MVEYRVADSGVAGAGRGFWLEQDAKAGTVLIAPAKVTHTVTLEQVFSPESCPGADTSVVWFESHCVVSPDYPDDFFINHSFEPNAVWHLGFVFALRDLTRGEELFLDYRHLVAPEHTLDFLDGATGKPIVGYAWKDSLRISSAQVLALAEKL